MCVNVSTPLNISLLLSAQIHMYKRRIICICIYIYIYIHVYIHLQYVSLWVGVFGDMFRIRRGSFKAWWRIWSFMALLPV